MEADERIREAIKRTSIVRLPKQSLYTFGITTINYYLVTEPAYTEETKEADETVVREGKVIAQRPRIVTPYYLTNLEGFSPEAKRYFEVLRQEKGDAPGLFYTYKNEPKDLNIIADRWLAVVERINNDIDQHGDKLAAIIKGEDQLWDVSLLKFIYEMTRHSLKDNITDLGSRGLLNMDASGIPSDARLRIEYLFDKVKRGELPPGDLKDELDRWGLFAEYEDRFLEIFKKKGI